jgi:D-sedoheptulose 7-phosphate isomerase
MNHHLTSLAVALQAMDAQASRLQSWGATAASVLVAGGRLLACGTGGSEAQVQHLANTLARADDDRPALDVAALSAVYPAAGAAADQPDGDLESEIREVGRRGDILLCVSASGGSEDLAACARAARDLGLVTWALTGPDPNQVAGAAAARPAARAGAHLRRPGFAY